VFRTAFWQFLSLLWEIFLNIFRTKGFSTVSLAGRAKEQMQNHIWFARFAFVIGVEIQNLFSGGTFQVSGFGQYFFSKQVFKFSAFSFGGVFFVGMVSGFLCQVAEIGFKVFGFRFGWRWFWLALFRGFGFVCGRLSSLPRHGFAKFPKSACLFGAKVLVKVKATLF